MNFIHLLNGKLAMDQYDSMSWQTFIHGLKLNLGLHIPLLLPPHPTLPLQIKVSIGSVERKTDLTSEFGPHYANI
jgi:hypothetical protein